MIFFVLHENLLSLSTVWRCGKVFSGIYEVSLHGGGRERGMGLLYPKRPTS
jgi:hypothetical protein